MRHLLKLFCIGFLTALLLPCLCACGNSGVVISYQGQTAYAIVYPSDSTEEEINVYTQLFTKLHIGLLSRFEIYDDSAPPRDGIKEILIGNTNRSESQEALSRLGEN